MTEWRHLVPDRPFIMGQMASFAPFFSRLDAPRSNTPFTFFVPSPCFLCENLSMVIPVHGGEWMKYLQIISAAALSHYWQKPNKQGYRGAACKYLVVSRKPSQTKSQKNPVQTSLWQILETEGGRNPGVADLFVRSKSLQRIGLFKQIDGNNLRSWINLWKEK